MMPPNKEEKGLLHNFYFWWLIVVGIIMVGIFGNYWAELGAGLTLLILGWATYKIKKKWFYTQEELCDVLFTNTDNAGNKVAERIMRIPPSEESQIISMYLQSMNPKETKNIDIRFGKEKSFFRKSVDILVNRQRMKRLWVSPSPYWWADFRMPTVVKDELSLQISLVIDIHLQNNASVGSVISNGEAFIWFDSPIRIPVGALMGADPAMKIDLEIIALNRWHGVIQCESIIDGVKQFATRKVEVSHKHKVNK